MRRTWGRALMALGVALMLAAAVTFAYTQVQAHRAATSADEALAGVQASIAARAEAASEGADSNSPTASAANADAASLLPAMPAPDTPMTEVIIGNFAYIGYLSIPAINLELPVMADWDTTRLHTAPCRQFGTTHGNDLVIMAHNYPRHFGRLKDLRAGDTLTFTDMDGNTTAYVAQAIDIVRPHDVAAVKDSPWDLVLYTCTYRTDARVVVGCVRAPKA